MLNSFILAVILKLFKPNTENALLKCMMRKYQGMMN